MSQWLQPEDVWLLPETDANAKKGDIWYFFSIEYDASLRRIKERRIKERVCIPIERSSKDKNPNARQCQDSVYGHTLATVLTTNRCITDANNAEIHIVVFRDGEMIVNIATESYRSSYQEMCKNDRQ